ncbi:RNA polymerase sigma factor [Fodinibius salsisoli]|uniref:RNA polymerase sigma-70 factor n=1 Tax=Fodinibius salsisoli TaxID=2820877 RepID=A0ABT3PHB7_9BACT|nr:RNA polymerase sigma-70 factor [Fodinibius salsisoli]MCW9705312.1 RNA polymerase sigma-70 factor [Fodinibius salsisoli]
MGRISDQQLVQKIRDGDREAFKKLYDRYHKQLYFLAKRYLKDQYLAEDAVQDIFIKIWNKRAKLRESSLKGYLFAMMKNHLIDTIRKQKSSTKVKEEFKKVSQQKPRREKTAEKIIYDEYREMVHKALDNLSPEERKVFEMKNFEGLSNAEVADKKDVSVNTVKTQFYLGSKYVRNYLKKHADIQ